MIPKKKKNDPSAPFDPVPANGSAPVVATGRSPLDEKARDAFIHEVEEELREQYLYTLWKKYGTMVVAAAILIVVMVAGSAGWNAYRASVNTKASDTFAQAQALYDTGKSDEALALLDTLANTAPAGYRVISLMLQASIYTEKGDTDKVLQAYDQIITGSGVQKTYRDFAQILSGYYRLQVGRTEGLAQVIAPLTDARNEWHYSALEITALLALKEGRAEDARTIFRDLANNTSTPSALRQRVSQILEVI